MAEHAHLHPTDTSDVARQTRGTPSAVEAMPRDIQPAARSSRLTATQVAALQRNAGNQAVSRLVGTVQRAEPSDADKQWAETANTGVEQVQDAVTTARGNLQDDARDALAAIRAVQAGYEDFEAMYDEALGKFTAGVAAAQAKELELRAFLSDAGNIALGVAFPLLAEVKGVAEGVLGKIEKAARVVSLLTPAPAAKSDGVARRGRPGQADWSELLSTTIAAFEKTLQQNAMLNALSTRCTENVRFLGRVRAGTYAGPSAQSSTEGARAAAMANNAAAAVRELSGVGSGEVSGPAKKFSDAAKERLNKVTIRRLEQDIGIRWISGLSPDQLDQIDTAEAYLSSIGVIDSDQNRLGYDTGAVTTDVDEKLIQWLAQAESTAMGLVGHNAEWLGGRSLGDGIGGQIRDSRNRHWNASAPAGTSEGGGGMVRITSYWINRSPGESSGWEWSHSADLQQYLRHQVSFSVVPLGATGGGATAEGPVLNAP